MELNIVAPGNVGNGSVEVLESAFARKYNEDLVHQIVTAYLAGGRQGSKAQKTRAMVRGGGKKPWKQKGSGRARAGSSTSPVWVGGGRSFAATPRSYDQKVNKKMYRAAIGVIMSELVRQDRIMVIDSIAIEKPKTKLLIDKMNGLGIKKGLFVTEESDLNLLLAGRNIPDVDICTVSSVNPVSLINFEKVIMTVGALKKFEEMLA